MYYSGYFRSLNTTLDLEGQLYKVVVITNFINNEYKFYGGELTLTDSPFTVSYESEDGNIFKPYKCSTATVGILQKQFNFEFSNTNGNNVIVMLLKEKKYNGTTAGMTEVELDNLKYNLEWIGYATPNTYSQEFENYLDGFELEAQDALSTLQYFPYKIETDSYYISFIDIIKNACKFLRVYKNIYVTTNLNIPTKDNADIMNFCIVDQRNFFDEDEKPKTYLEVIEQLLQYLNLTIIPYGDSLFILDYGAIRNGNNKYYHYRINKDSGHFLIDTDVDYILQEGKVEFEDIHDIKEDDFSSTGTKLTLLSTYNKMSVRSSLYSFDSLIDLGDMKRWKYSDTYDVPTYYDLYNVISESNGEFIKKSDGFIDYNYIDPEDLRTNKKTDRNLTVICNSRNDKKKQKVFLKYITIGKGKEFLFNNFYLYCNAYSNDTKDNQTGKWRFGSYVTPQGNYNFMRNHVCCNLIAYATEEVEQFSNNPKELELKPALLISTPSEFSATDYYNKNYIPYADTDLQPMAYILTKEFCGGSGDYLNISFKAKYYRHEDCLPIDEGDSEYTPYFPQIRVGVRFVDKTKEDWGNHRTDYLNMDGSPQMFNYADMLDNKKVFNSNLEIQNSLTYKDELDCGEGEVFDFYYSLNENTVETGQLEIVIYRPISPTKDKLTKAVLITDFEVKIVTKSEINSINPTNDDTDSEYSIVINANAVEEKNDITCEITTWDYKQPNYSSVLYYDGFKQNNTAKLHRMQQLFNRSTGEILRPEEHIIYNNILQYSTPTIRLDLNLHKEPKPYSLFSYHYFDKKLFIVDSVELDYLNNSYNINLVEKK